MITNLHIIDNFYTNVDEVRAFALDQSFDVKGNYPGMRTAPEKESQSTYLKKFFEEKVMKEKIIHWPVEYNTAYQFTTIEDKTWIHHDNTTWAAVVYLTPEAPIESGTAIYRHKESGIFNWSPEDKIDYNNSKEVHNLNNWEQIMFAANIYNRMVLYRGSLYHRSVLPGFGHNKYTGRLFQTFFFNTL
jgi:hypothetical protein